ncbi:unnamed protein product [Cochlearia groenlandica]
MNHINVFLIFTVVLYVESYEVCQKNTLVFQNHLFSSQSILKVHCKSRNDDLGDHFVKFEGPTYNFSFHDTIDFILYTKFNCKLWKGAKLEYHQSFRAYTAPDIIIRCGALYTWDARDDAIYLSKDDGPEELKHQWIKD